jgi:curved DNA-binding protein
MNHYQVLGITSSATQDEVKQAYRKLAMKHHPDRGGDEAEFKKIKEAYEAITSGKGNSHDATQDFGDFNFQDLHDLFNKGRAAGARDFNFNWRDADIKNPDINISVPCTLEEAHSGFTKSVEFTTPEGVTKKLEVTFPPGTTRDIRVKHAGLGGCAITSRPPGDLYVSVAILLHKTWSLDRQDLYSIVNISVWQAMFGTTILLQEISGSAIEVTIPPGTQYNSKLCLRGRGMNIRGTNQRGNAYITIEVTIPKLDPDDRTKTVVDIEHKIK